MNEDPLHTWLLEDSCLAVKHRALAELFRADAEALAPTRAALLGTLAQATNASWQTDATGLWLAYHLTALAECGLTRHDIDVDTAVDRYLTVECDAACADALGLRALVMLGYGEDDRVRGRLSLLADSQLPDGGYLCLHRLRRMKRTPKSCYKDNALMLMLFAECAKRGIRLPNVERLIAYFRRHAMFYRTDGTALVLANRSGWRSIDAFYPFEAMRVGIQNIVEAMAALGCGDIEEMNEAWSLLDGKRRDDGYVLEGTMTRSYLPKEKVGQASKWVTLYALLAHKHAGR